MKCRTPLQCIFLLKYISTIQLNSFHAHTPNRQTGIISWYVLHVAFLFLLYFWLCCIIVLYLLYSFIVFILCIIPIFVVDTQHLYLCLVLTFMLEIDTKATTNTDSTSVCCILHSVHAHMDVICVFVRSHVCL